MNARRTTAALVWLVALGAGCNAVIDNSATPLSGGDASVYALDASLDGTVITSFDAATVDAAVADAADGSDAYAAPDAPFDAGTIPTCANQGDKLCNGACVAVDDALFGCGPTTCSACELTHATATCNSAGCTVGACENGYADCDQKAANGCEVDLSQPSHCGACNAKCGAAAPDCSPTAAGGFACTTGCTNGSPTLCGKQCVDLTTSLDNCGSCGHACSSVANGTATCSAGHCAFTCRASFHACGSVCVSNVAPATCGNRCTACQSGPESVATCNGTTCGLACQVHYASCDGYAANGCEVDLRTSASSCGMCGHSCSGGTCVNGTCSAPPADASAPDASPPDDASTPPDDAAPPEDAATE